mmetsp:Transcript_76243/g.218480  ORF Transcript_76243/g.218480 Transcript_76243/m.218480 type:complete len:257 (+) Transcript_76243:1699-2469(+)
MTVAATRSDLEVTSAVRARFGRNAITSSAAATRARMSSARRASTKFAATAATSSGCLAASTVAPKPRRAMSRIASSESDKATLIAGNVSATVWAPSADPANDFGRWAKTQRRPSRPCFGMSWRSNSASISARVSSDTDAIAAAMPWAVPSISAPSCCASKRASKSEEEAAAPSPTRAPIACAAASRTPGFGCESKASRGGRSTAKKGDNSSDSPACSTRPRAKLAAFCCASASPCLSARSTTGQMSAQAAASMAVV